MDRACKRCLFWEPMPSVDPEIGECRVSPPTIHPGLTQDELDRGRFYAVFPLTYDDEWCGAFAPAPAASEGGA